MARIIETTAYEFHELSDSAKEKAREWYRQSGAGDTFWRESVIEDAKQVGALMGITIEKVYYSGFGSQGDGACFAGKYKHEPDSAAKVKEYAPYDERLHKIAVALCTLQNRSDCNIEATTFHHGPYCHSGSMCVNTNLYHNDIEMHLVDVLRSFADWIYRQLEKDYSYQQSDEAVDEAIVANGYEFTAEGRMVQ